MMAASEISEAFGEEWQVPSAPPSLDSASVHIWRARLDRPENETDQFFCILAPDEQRRAQRFHFEDDRRRFTVARGILRSLLSSYTNTEPAAVTFRYSSYGKPSLGDTPSIRFNVSHSGGLALYAVALNREVGVDVERFRPEFAGEPIAERFFSEREVTILRGLARNQVVEAFFSCWTRKEAYIKARGKGLSIPLDQFDVSLAPGEPAELHADRDAPEQTGRWSLWNLSPGRGFAGAAAVEGHDCQLWYGQWPDGDHRSAFSSKYSPAQSE